MVDEIQKKSTSKKKGRYTTIITLRTSMERLCLARDTWKVQNRDFKKLGLMPFILYLLDFYEENKLKDNLKEL